MQARGFRLFYCYSGGAPPPSLEELTVWEDGMAQYLAGHPWPKQPPFDEIGLYRRALAAEEWQPLERTLDAAAERGAQPTEALRYADSGLESLRARLAGGEYAALWTAARAPDELVPVRAAVRQLISALRKHPFSTIHAALVLAAPGRSLDAARLRLHNRGVVAFSFYGLSAPEEHRIEVRLQSRAVDQAAPSRPTSPIRLLAVEPTAAIASQAPPSISDAQVSLNPGESVSVELSVDAACADVRSRQGGLVLDSLVRVCFRRVTLEGQTIVEQGWLTPEPVPLHRAPTGSDSA